MGQVSLKGLRKSYGAVDVIRGIDLDIRDGEFMVFVGPSGCGKSTTLRMIAGLETITAGDLLIDGERANDLHPADRGAAMVFQSYALYPHMTVAENMGFALKMAGVDKVQRDKQVSHAAEILRMTDLLGRFPKELSGGQRQRVAIGRCIVREPAIFLFDEPLSNLDAKLRGHMRTELAMLHERLGKTTIYVTHDQVEAMTLASRIVIFHKGHIQQVGTPAEVFNRPAHLFVAGFIGMPSMNLLEGKVVTQGSQTLLRGAGFELSLPASTAWPQQVVAGVRPQALRLATGAGALQLQVDVVEYLGTESVLVGKLAGGSETRVTAVLDGHRIDLLHQTVALDFDASELHAFDKASGLRISV